MNFRQNLWGCEDDGTMGYVSQLASEVCDGLNFGVLGQEFFDSCMF